MRQLLLALIFLGACAQPASTIRSTTYPPEFAYLTRGDLRSEMQALARHVFALNAILREDAPDGQRVLGVLKDIEKVAAELDGHGRKTNHPQLDDRLDLFIRDIRGARQGAESTPPNYYLAGAIAGSCYHCHR